MSLQTKKQTLKMLSNNIYHHQKLLPISHYMARRAAVPVFASIL
jgi:hypothetical protein